MSVILRDDSGKELKLQARAFHLDPYTKSGVFLDAIVKYAGMTVRGTTTLTKPYRIENDEDAASVARLVIADFLKHLSSVVKSSRSAPELDRNAEWRLYIQSRTYHLYHAAQQCTFPLDLLEEAAEFGQYCSLLRLVFLYFLAGDEHCYADRLSVIAEQLLNSESRSRVVRL